MNKIILSLILLTGFISTSNSQPLLEAIDAKDFDKVEQLLKSGEKVNKTSDNGQFALWRAVWSTEPKMVALLLKYGADAKQKFKGKERNLTLLEIAAQEGPLETVKLLAEAGADINEPGVGGQTPLRIASRNGLADIVTYLLDKGANVNTRAEDGATPLEHAASKGHLDVIKILVERGATINTQDNDRDFPLGEAAKAGFANVVEFLLAKGADPSLKNKNGENAVDIAKLAGQPKIVAMLKAHMNN